jgi:peptide/nickel transport system permease protein
MNAPAQTVLIRRRLALPRRLAAQAWLATPATAVCAVLILVAILAPWIAPHDPLAVEALNANADPSWVHPLGTDEVGRDLLSRLMHGARYSLAGPALVVLLAVSAGVALAFLAAWNGGWVEAVIARAIDVMLAFPGLILAISVVTIFGAGFFPPIIALAIAYAPGIARVLSPVIRRERNLAYVTALDIQGASAARIWIRHLLPNIAPIIVVQAAIFYGYAMLDLAAISFLGLGVQAPTPEWGVMAATGQSSIVAGFPQQSLYASLIVTVSVVAINIVGDRLARYFDVEEYA